MRKARNLLDVVAIMYHYGYVFTKEYKDIKKKTVLCFEHIYNKEHQFNMQYFIGNKFNVTSTSPTRYIIKRV